jgi:diadenosine tetraphosphate (Ap4A) HIT family hydrolase
MTYDPNNIFAKILRGEIPAKKVYEDEFALAFHDIAPNAPTHILVIPKGEYCNFAEFSASAPASLVQGFFASIAKIAAQQNLADYRLITNNGAGAGQTVHHFHVHILAGRKMDALLP